MPNETPRDDGRRARAPLDMPGEEFRAAGHWLVDRLADLYDSLARRPVTAAEPPRTLRDLIGRGDLPESPTDARALLEEVVPLLWEHSLHNGHPRFFGYVTSSAAPLGALADLLAASVNPNVGLWSLAPAASEIESQTVRWLAQLVGFDEPCGGLLCSGGNMANFLAFAAARRARIPWDVRTQGLRADGRTPVVYGSREMHTWIEKAADLTGLGTAAIRWIETDAEQRLLPAALEREIEHDREAGRLPLLAVGTAGAVGTGAIDPLPAMADICRTHGLWFHVDGAYGAPAAVLPDAPAELKALRLADSIALDPHKWLYTPLEAACVIVRDPAALRAAFSYRPSYYHLDDDGEAAGLNYYEHGLQNSRGFRALKVWLCLRAVGRAGYERMIRDDIALARRLHSAVQAHPELEAGTQHLSITTFRYAPCSARADDPAWRTYLDELNVEVLSALQKRGETYLSNALVAERKFLRACIVNFRTKTDDVDALPEIVARTGRRIDEMLRPAALR